MKKIILVLFVLTVPSIIMASPYDDMADELFKKIKNKKIAIAVMPFSYPTDPEVGVGIAEEVAKALIDKGANIVERSQLAKVFKEQKLQMLGMVDNTTAGRLARGVGAQYVVIGSAKQFHKKGYKGPGLRIFARVVHVTTYRALVASNIEVSRDDFKSKYRRGVPRGHAQYPSFLEVMTGISFLNRTAVYDDPDLDREITTDNQGYERGFPIIFRYVKPSAGFFTWAYEVSYLTQKLEDDGYRYKFYSANIPFFIRIPLWRYFESLGDYTCLYFGPLVGFSFTKVEYYNSESSIDDSSYGMGWNLLFHFGLKLGLNENISFNFEYRYIPRTKNYLWHLQEFNDNTALISNHIGGHQLLAGISFAP